MFFNKIPFKSSVPCAIIMLLLLITNGVVAGEGAGQKDSKPFSPDPAEYHAISDEEAFELSVAEDEYDPSPGEENLPGEGDFLPETGSSVTYCNEANCDSVIVVFGGVSHPAYLSCDDMVLFSNIPAGTYSWSSSGCGRVSMGYLSVDGVTSYRIRICPSPTQKCCVNGCLGRGSYGCWQCIMPQTATSSTTTTKAPQATTTIPETTTSSPESTTQPNADTFTLSGYITGDVTADISLQLKGSDSRTAVTNEDGYYEFFVLENGYYAVTPHKEGWEFEPPHYVIQNLTRDVSYMDFVAILREEGPPCPLEMLYGEESEETKILRRFRDNVLSRTQKGREYIQLYYRWAPVISEVMEQDEAFQANVKDLIDGVLPLIRAGIK